MPKRNPVTAMAGHLSWTNTGVTWATWRIATPMAYGRRSVKDKQVVRDLHRVLLRALSGEALLLGLAVTIDPVTVVERQIEGIRLEDCPQLAEEATANLDRLEGLVLGERTYYLAMPLRNTGRHAWSAPATAGLGWIQDALQLPRARPPEAEVQARLVQAAQIQTLLPVPFGATPVTVAEQLWLAEHNCRRGMVDVCPPEPGSLQQQLALSSGSALPEPILDEGAWSDPDAPQVRNPLARKVLKVTEPRMADLGQPSSYQVPMVLTDTPPGGLPFPGSEVLASLDEVAQDVDWAIRLRVAPRDEVMRANRHAINKLRDQFEQRQDETTLGRTDLDHAATLLGEYHETFGNDRLEVEVRHTLILTLGDTTAQGVIDRADQLSKVFAGSDFKFERPVGQLTNLWWAGHVGASLPEVARSNEQLATSHGLSALVPFTGTQLGTRRGMCLAINQSSSRPSIMHHDAGGIPELDKSGSIVWMGELGSGKTVGQKTFCTLIHDEGGQVLVIDKSADGEWARWGQALTNATISDPDDPQVSSDPLRVLGREEGSATLASFLTQLLGVSPQEQDGHVLGQVLSPHYLAEHQLTSAGQVMEHLATSCELPHATRLGQVMRTYADKAIGRLVFDPTLPPIQINTPAVIWRTHRMSQPKPREIEQAHLFRQLPPEKVFGRAYYSLILGLSRSIGFADPTRPTVLDCDEAHDIFGNPENAETLERVGREGRRPKFLLCVGSHDIDYDFGTDTLRELIPTRVAMRQSSLRLAQAQVRYLGIDQDDPDFTTMVKELIEDISPVIGDGVPIERRGECFMRDAFGAVGRAKILAPANPRHYDAVMSTPAKRSTHI